MGRLGFGWLRKSIRQSTLKDSIASVARYGGKDYLDQEMLLAVIRTSWLSVDVFGGKLWSRKAKISALSLLRYYMISPAMMKLGVEYRRNIKDPKFPKVEEEAWPKHFDYEWTDYDLMQKDHPKLAAVLLAEAIRRDEE